MNLQRLGGHTARLVKHRWTLDPEKGSVCIDCGKVRDIALTRQNRNNRARGGAAELEVAKLLGGQRVGPLGLPWDVTIDGYARLQVRKYASPESLRKIAAELDRIPVGAEMRGYVWIEPGRGGRRLIVFDLDEFSERHGGQR